MKRRRQGWPPNSHVKKADSNARTIERAIAEQGAQRQIREIIGRMRAYAPSLRGTGIHASDASYNRTLRDANYLEALINAAEKAPTNEE